MMPVMACVQACMKMDETLYHVADKIKNFAVMYDDAPIFVAVFQFAPARARTREPSPAPRSGARAGRMPTPRQIGI